MKALLAHSETLEILGLNDVRDPVQREGEKDTYEPMRSLEDFKKVKDFTFDILALVKGSIDPEDKGAMRQTGQNLVTKMPPNVECLRIVFENDYTRWAILVWAFIRSIRPHLPALRQIVVILFDFSPVSHVIRGVLEMVGATAGIKVEIHDMLAI